MERVRVFISSTFQDLQREREYVAMVCERMGLEARYYPESSVAGTGSREFIDRLSESHILVYIATRSSDAVEAELKTAEFYGIPIIEIAEVAGSYAGDGKRISPVAVERRSKAKTYQASFETLGELDTRLSSALGAVLWRRFASALELNPFGDEAYKQATRSIQSAHYRLGTAQETSTLFLGARSSHPIAEGRFYEEMVGLLQDLLAGKRDVDFIHVFDAEQTAHEFWTSETEYPDRQAALRLMNDLADQIEAHPRVQVAPVAGPITAAVINDASLEMATRLGERYYLWLNEVGGAAKDLWDILNIVSRKGESLPSFLERVAAGPPG